jgi:hypothetical protein
LRPHDQSVSVGRQAAADRRKDGVLPGGARILTVADGYNGSGAHADIGWANRTRLDEIARIVDLSRNRRLGGAAEVRVRLVLPSFD